MKWLITVFMTLFIMAKMYALTSQPNIIHAQYTNEAIKLDGKLDEPVWGKAIPISNFTQRELNIGEPATERTVVAIV